MSQEIELVIEELVLEGFAPAERGRIGAALAAELEHLLRAEGLPPRLARAGLTERLVVDGFVARPGERAELVGARVARAIYAGLLQ